MADSDLEQKLEEEFGMFGFDISGDISVLEKLSSLCTNHNIDVEKILAEWIGYSHANNNKQISEEALIEFEKKKLLQSKANVPRKSNSTPHRSNTYNIKSIANASSFNEEPDDEDNMLETYATTPQGKANIKRLKETPEESHNAKRFAGSITPNISNSTPHTHDYSTPSALSTPSEKYESRNHKGDVIACYGISEQTNIDWKGTGEDVKVKDYNDSINITKPYKHMFQKLQDKADVLNEIIANLSNQMKDKFLLDEFESVAIKTQEKRTSQDVDVKNQEDINVAGRICCDSVGRINSKSVVLEGSRETSAGQRIPLDLTDVKSYSLFPGQIVTVQGRNTSGSKFFPKSISTGTKLPFYCASKKDAVIRTGHFTVFVACGPYATCDTTLSYTPLDDLLKTVEREKPDVLIMLGPFVDSKQPIIEETVATSQTIYDKVQVHFIQKGDIDDTYEDLFQHCKDKVKSCIERLSTKALFVPSQRDVFHHFIYPQPPFEQDDGIKMFSDPCTLMINDVCFGISSTDILFHLGAEEVSSVRSDRLGRLAGHLLQQQCYYPLHPVSEDVNLDYERFENHGFMPVTPDVLIVPSDLRYFVKNVEDCLCINPGRLVKGQSSGGTFAKLLVKPKKPLNANKSTVVDHSIAQIVRI